MSAPLIEFANVTVCRARRPVVHHLSCAFPAGAFVGIVGPNGAGKTSLLQAVLGWLPMTSGSIAIGGKPARANLHRCSYLAQRQNVDLDYPLTVGDLVAMGRYQRLGFARAFGAEDRHAVETAIDELAIRPLRDRPISSLSGGQLQRAFLARALATGADIFLFDEPLAGLDATTCDDLLRRLRDWGSHGRLVISVIHDLAAAATFCSHLVLLNNHLIAAGPTAEVYNAANLEATFGKGIRRILDTAPAGAGAGNSP